jgi:hypothetical protein
MSNIEGTTLFMTGAFNPKSYGPKNIYIVDYTNSNSF